MDIIAQFFACFSQKLASARKNSTNWLARLARFCNSDFLLFSRLWHLHFVVSINIGPRSTLYGVRGNEPDLFTVHVFIKIENYTKKENVLFWHFECTLVTWPCSDMLFVEETNINHRWLLIVICKLDTLLPRAQLCQNIRLEVLN